MPLKNRLTPKQNQIYDYILAFTQERGYPLLSERSQRRCI